MAAKLKIDVQLDLIMEALVQHLIENHDFHDETVLKSVYKKYSITFRLNQEFIEAIVFITESYTVHSWLQFSILKGEFVYNINPQLVRRHVNNLVIVAKMLGN